MKKASVARIVGFALLAGMWAAPAKAARSGDQGIGLMVGNPSGLTWKMFLDDHLALDAALGVDQGDFDVHATLLYHDFDLFKRSPAFADLTNQGDLGLYFGIGPRELFAHDSEFCLRLPVGVNYLPHSEPYELFVELAPVIRFNPSSGMDFDYAIGARYYFPAIRPQSH